MEGFSVKSIIIFVLMFSVTVQADVFKEKSFKRPTREVSIIITEDGFYPNKVMAFQGEKVRFFVTSTVDDSQCFLLQKHEVFLSAEKGKVNEGETLLDHAGRFKFYCPSSKFEGYLTVFEKFKAEAKQKRDIASDSKPNYWLPRDYD